VGYAAIGPLLLSNGSGHAIFLGLAFAWSFLCSRKSERMHVGDMVSSPALFFFAKKKTHTLRCHLIPSDSAAAAVPLEKSGFQRVQYLQIQSKSALSVINLTLFRSWLVPISRAILSRSCLLTVTYKSVVSTQDGRGKSGNKSL
jgi:hypothetical protein